MNAFRLAASLSLALIATAALLPATATLVTKVHAAPAVRVELDQLELPPEAKAHERFLRRVLQREARKLDWGAGAGSRIEYRFAVSELSVKIEGEVLTVHCSAVGRLPRGRTARSQLSFGGELHDKKKLIERVLTIVARGVLTRLSEIERGRRSKG